MLDATFGPEVRFHGVPPDLKPNRPPDAGLPVFWPDRSGPAQSRRAHRSPSINTAGTARVHAAIRSASQLNRMRNAPTTDRHPLRRQLLVPARLRRRAAADPRRRCARRRATATPSAAPICRSWPTPATWRCRTMPRPRARRSKPASALCSTNGFAPIASAATIRSPIRSCARSRRQHRAVTILHIDAHGDLYDEFEGDRFRTPARSRGSWKSSCARGWCRSASGR